MDIKDRLEDVDHAKIFFTDLNGRLRSLSVNPDHMVNIMETGIGFDGSSVAGIATVDYSDRVLLPIPESLRVIEFGDGKLGFLAGKILNEHGERSRSDPRAVLEKVLDEAETAFGFRFLAGPEYEFFLLDSDEFDGHAHSDGAGYFHSDPDDRGEIVRRDIVGVLGNCGIRFEKSHHEVTASQHEINLECGDPLAIADRHLLVIHATKKVAAEHGYHATFMSKPFDGQNRNAFHIHLSVQDLKGGNAFYAAGAEHNVSQAARQFIGGILKYARETSIMMASTFNSYKAYVLEREAPIIRGWGLMNRSSMVRLPYTGGPEATRIELRTPDAMGNIYLQLATLIGMGLQGLKEGLDCGSPDVGNTYRNLKQTRIWDKRFLPKCMFEALVEAERSKFLKDLLGERIFENYMAIKVADWEEHRTHLTPREHDKYLIV